MIKYALPLLLALIVSACARAENIDTLFEKFLWQNRPLLIFSPSTDTPEFIEQTKILADAKNAIKERDIIVFKLIDLQSVNINGHHKHHLGTPPFYKRFNVPSDEFTLILIGKDGTEKYRNKTATPIETITQIIDAMPMRKREVQGQSAP